MEEEIEEPSPGIVGLCFAIAVIVLVGACFIYGLLGPYRMADELREKLDSYGNVSDDYRQGWLDCIATYLKISIGPQNATENVRAEI